MEKTDKEEILEILSMLEKSGVDYDIPHDLVPYYSEGVRCGMPTESVDGKMEMVLDQMRKTGSPELNYKVRAVGDSMIGANIYDGDDLMVRYTGYNDGDIIVVSINGEFTVKRFFKDLDGKKWLLPENDAYSPIPFNDGDEVFFFGKVTDVTHKVRSKSFSECHKLLHSKGQADENEKEVPTSEQVEKSVRSIECEIHCARHWYAVFRVLVDRHYYKETDLDRFVLDLEQWCPENVHPADKKDLGKMSVYSFAKPVKQWDSRYSPVSGKTFAKYLNVAINFNLLLK